MTPKEVLTPREAAEYLGVDTETIYRHIGEMPAFKLGNRWRFKKDLLDRWIERRSERPAAGAAEPVEGGVR